jgi:aryl-alcohol dehydrogenase-like predicted oxidoreductase
MRLSTDPDRDEARAVATVRAALDAGIDLLDTARAYGLDDADAGHNERLIARAAHGRPVRIVTKCGMRRPGGGWRPDGRARAIAGDARESADALGEIPIELLLLHAVDPATSLATSVRALAKAAGDGLARRIGLSNVTRTQLEEALRIAPVSAIEVPLGAFDDASARGGAVRFASDHGMDVLAYGPLGGPKRAAKLARDPVLAELGAALGATAQEVMLAYLLHLDPRVVPLVGARRPETARSAARSAELHLDAAALRRLDARFPGLAVVRGDACARPPSTDREVVLIMGLPGSGKSRAAVAWVARGYERLNRDLRGGTLRGLSRALDERLGAGADRVVLDNTYLSRASRSDVVRAAHRHGARVRCVHVDAPLAEAQINVVSRMIERYGELLEPERVASEAKRDPGLIRPLVLFRMLRELERPALDEGFDDLEVRPFVFEAARPHARRGAAIALDAVLAEASGRPELRDGAAALVSRTPEAAPCLLVAFRPGADPVWRARVTEIAGELAAATGRAVELGLCSHEPGPPTCWCRPPLPGLWLAFAARNGIDPRRGLLIGAGAALQAMARALGLDFAEA